MRRGTWRQAISNIEAIQQRNCYLASSPADADLPPPLHVEDALEYDVEEDDAADPGETVDPLVTLGAAQDDVEAAVRRMTSAKSQAVGATTFVEVYGREPWPQKQPPSPGGT